MARSGHDPSWPDKIVFANVLVVIAGALGILFAALRLGLGTVEQAVPGILEFVPAWWSLGWSSVAVAAGWQGIKRQAVRWTWFGVAAAVLSLAVFGLVGILGIVALTFVVKAKMEGEEMRDDEHLVPADQWPDKALIAGLLLNVAAAVTGLQGVLMLVGRLAALGGLDIAWGAVSLVAAVFLAWCASQVARLERPWPGIAGGIVAIGALGFYILGPVLGLVALELMRRAGGEGEFATTA